MEDPIMSGLNFMANPPINRMAAEAERNQQLVLDRIMKSHSKPQPQNYMNGSLDYMNEMPPNQNPYIASPSSLFGDGPVSYIQPPSTLYNYNNYQMSNWQQGMQRGYPPSLPHSYPPSQSNMYHMMNQHQRDPYYAQQNMPSMDIPNGPQSIHPNEVPTDSKLSMSEFVSLARASQMYSNNRDGTNPMDMKKPYPVTTTASYSQTASISMQNL
jgi:hypothetical protein